MTAGGSEPIEPIILGPGGTFGMDPLKVPRPTIRPVVPDASGDPGGGFLCAAGGCADPVGPEAPAAPAAEFFAPAQPETAKPPVPVTDFFPLDTDSEFEAPTVSITPAAPPPVSAEGAVCQLLCAG